VHESRDGFGGKKKYVLTKTISTASTIEGDGSDGSITRYGSDAFKSIWKYDAAKRKVTEKIYENVNDDHYVIYQTETWKYNAAGLIKSFSVKEDNGTKTSVVFTYSYYTDGNVKKQTAREDGKVIYIKKYDENQNLIKETYYKESGDPAYEVTGEYDDNGRIKKWNYHTTNTTSDKDKYRTFEYDENNRLTGYHTCYTDGSSAGYCMFQRDAEGRKTVETLYGTDGTTTVNTWEYNAAGQLTGKTEHSYNGTELTHIYLYDSHGNLTKDTYTFYQSGITTDEVRYYYKAVKTNFTPDLWSFHNDTLMNADYE